MVDSKTKYLQKIFTIKPKDEFFRDGTSSTVDKISEIDRDVVKISMKNNLNIISEITDTFEGPITRS